MILKFLSFLVKGKGICTLDYAPPLGSSGGRKDLSLTRTQINFLGFEV